MEAWVWLEAQALLVPADDNTNGRNGWRPLIHRAMMIPAICSAMSRLMSRPGLSGSRIIA